MITGYVRYCAIVKFCSENMMRKLLTATEHWNLSIASVEHAIKSHFDVNELTHNVLFSTTYLNQLILQINSGITILSSCDALERQQTK